MDGSGEAWHIGHGKPLASRSDGHVTCYDSYLTWVMVYGKTGTIHLTKMGK
ncbi:hypothetical protein KNP414_03604 [Paenibacillus mucilaginosus KNP414]|uniref:Uncharacterized protein n=1 Tax=Paenibacillus mucilaginosus (strain KNP414) TaxID=1036673 RepID=F8FDH8_PAEMK|nr:hypothetical protein KNP414_03604 [Paenibacillus mucilaginosus KNP414]